MTVNKNRTLKLARINTGYSQKQLAEILGISHATIVRMEKGNYDSCRLGLLKNISKVLNTPFEELFLSEE